MSGWCAAACSARTGRCAAPACCASGAKPPARCAKNCAWAPGSRLPVRRGFGRGLRLPGRRCSRGRTRNGCRRRTGRSLGPWLAPGQHRFVGERLGPARSGHAEVAQGLARRQASRCGVSFRRRCAGRGACCHRRRRGAGRRSVDTGGCARRRCERGDARARIGGLGRRAGDVLHHGAPPAASVFAGRARLCRDAHRSAGLRLAAATPWSRTLPEANARTTGGAGRTLSRRCDRSARRNLYGAPRRAWQGTAMPRPWLRMWMRLVPRCCGQPAVPRHAG